MVIRKPLFSYHHARPKMIRKPPCSYHHQPGMAIGNRG
jgi:hypothetical protein